MGSVVTEVVRAGWRLRHEQAVDNWLEAKTCSGIGVGIAGLSPRFFWGGRVVVEKTSEVNVATSTVVL